MKLKAHVSSINMSAYQQLKNTIKPFLDIKAANTAPHACVSSHSDEGNSILYSIV